MGWISDYPEMKDTSGADAFEIFCRHFTTLEWLKIFKFGKLCLNMIKDMTQNTADQNINWTASREFGTYRLCEQRRFRRACASAQSRQNLRCSLIQAVNQEEHSDRKPDPWPS